MPDLPMSLLKTPHTNKSKLTSNPNRNPIQVESIHSHSSVASSFHSYVDVDDYDYKYKYDDYIDDDVDDENDGDVNGDGDGVSNNQNDSDSASDDDSKDSKDVDRFCTDVNVTNSNNNNNDNNNNNNRDGSGMINMSMINTTGISNINVRNHYNSDNDDVDNDDLGLDVVDDGDGGGSGGEDARDEDNYPPVSVDFRRDQRNNANNASNSNINSNKYTRKAHLPPSQQQQQQQQQHTHNRNHNRNHNHNQFKRRYMTLKKIYTSRILHLTTHLTSTQNDIANSDVLNVMRSDDASNLYVERAVSGFLEKGVRGEREDFIHVLARKVASLDNVNFEIRRQADLRSREFDKVKKQLLQYTSRTTSRDDTNKLKTSLIKYQLQLKSDRNKIKTLVDDDITKSGVHASEVMVLNDRIEALITKNDELSVSCKLLQDKDSESTKAMYESEKNKALGASSLIVVSRDLENERSKNGTLVDGFDIEKNKAVKYHKECTALKELNGKVREDYRHSQSNVQSLTNEVNTLKQKFTTISQQMEVMLITETSETSTTIQTLQNRIHAIKSKHSDAKSHNIAVLKNLRLEMNGLDSSLSSSRRECAGYLDKVKRHALEITRLTSDNKTLHYQLKSSKLKSSQTNMHIKDSLTSKNSVDSNNHLKVQALQYKERLEDRVRSTAREVEDKVKEVCRVKYDKKEQDIVSKFETEVSNIKSEMKSDYDKLVGEGKVDRKEWKTKEHAYTTDYIPKGQAVTQQLYAVAVKENEMKVQYEHALEVNVMKVKEEVRGESLGPLNIVKDEVKAQGGIIDELRALVVRRDGEIVQNSGVIDGLKSDVDAIKSDNLNLKVKLDESQITLNQLTLTKTEVEGERDNAQTEVTQLKRAINDDERDVTIDKLQATQTNLEQSVASITELNEELSTKLKTSDVEMKQLTSANNDLKADNLQTTNQLNLIQQRYTDQVTRYADLETAHESQSGTVESLRVKLSECMSEYSASEVERSEVFHKRMADSDDKSSAELATVMNEKRRLEDEVGTVGSDNARLVKEKEVLETKVGGLKEEAHARDEEVKRLKSEGDELARKLKVKLITVTAQSKTLAQLRKVISTQLVPLKHELRLAKQSVQNSLLMFTHELTTAINGVQSRWRDFHRDAVERYVGVIGTMERRFDDECAKREREVDLVRNGFDAKLREGEENERKRGVDAKLELDKVQTLLNAETDNNTNETHAKNNTILNLKVQVEELTTLLENNSKGADFSKDELSNQLNSTRSKMSSDLLNVTHKLEKAEATIIDLQARKDELLLIVEDLKNTSSRNAKSSDVTENKVQKYKNKLAMLVVALESELKFNERIENGLLSDRDHEGDGDDGVFRGALRELTLFFGVKKEEFTALISTPLLSSLNESQSELKEALTNLNSTRTTQTLASNRVSELEANESKLEAKLNELTLQQEQLTSRSNYADDMERSRSDVLMLSELQRIERDSEIKALKLDFVDLKRRNVEDVKQVQRRFERSLHDEREGLRRDARKLIVDKSSLEREHEAALTAERTKCRVVQDKLHQQTQAHAKVVSEMREKVSTLEGVLEKERKKEVLEGYLMLEQRSGEDDDGGDGFGGSASKKQKRRQREQQHFLSITSVGGGSRSGDKPSTSSNSMKASESTSTKIKVESTRELFPLSRSDSVGTDGSSVSVVEELLVEPR